MIGSGWANSCADELISNGWIPCFILVFEETDESGGGKAGKSTRTVVSKTAFNRAQIAQIQREDEELIAMIAVVGRAIL